MYTYEYKALYINSAISKVKELSVKLKYFNLLSHIRAYKKIAIKTVVFDNRQQILQIMQIIFKIKHLSVIHCFITSGRINNFNPFAASTRSLFLKNNFEK